MATPKAVNALTFLLGAPWWHHRVFDFGQRPRTGRYNPLDDLKRTISMWHKFGLPLSRESILPQVKPNPILRFKDQCLAPLVGMLDIIAYLPFSVKLDVVVQVFNKGSFFKTICLCNMSSMPHVFATCQAFSKPRKP